MTRKILIIGAGGIGSYLISFLDRIGIYELHVADPDIVENKNLTYQNFQLGHVGQNKALVMGDLYNSVWGANKYAVLTNKQLQGFDLVVCCADNLDVRRLLYNSDIKWLDLRSQGRNAVLISHELDKDMFDTVLQGPEGSFSCQGDNWSGRKKDIHFTHTAVAGMGAQWIQRWFNDEEVDDFKIINI